MNPTALTLPEPVSRGRGPLTRAAAAVGGLAVLLTSTATGHTLYSTPAPPATPTALTSLSTSVVGLGVMGVTGTALSALARTGGER